MTNDRRSHAPSRSTAAPRVTLVVEWRRWLSKTHRLARLPVGAGSRALFLLPVLRRASPARSVGPVETTRSVHGLGRSGFFSLAIATVPSRGFHPLTLSRVTANSRSSLVVPRADALAGRDGKVFRGCASNKGEEKGCRLPHRTQPCGLRRWSYTAAVRPASWSSVTPSASASFTVVRSDGM